MSEKLLPIVPGCRALVIKSRWGITGEVTVHERHSEHNCWYIDSPSIRALLISYGKKRYYADECDLLRIDGFDFKHERDSYELPREINV